MKRQVHPHVPSGRLGTPSGSGQAGVCAIAGRTGLGRGLVDGRNNRSDCPLDNLRSFLLALVFGTSRAAGKALQRLFDNQIVDQAALALRREWPQLRSWPRSFLCVVAASWLTFVMAWLELYSLTAIRGLYSGSSQRTGLSGDNGERLRAFAESSQQYRPLPAAA
jgi:hypothetical protein